MQIIKLNFPIPGSENLIYGEGSLECFKAVVDGFPLVGSEIYEGTPDTPFVLIDHPRFDQRGLVFRGQIQGHIGNLAHFQLGLQFDFKEKSAQADIGDGDRILNADDFG